MTKEEVLLGRLMEERLTPGADRTSIDERIRTAFEEEWCVVHTNMTSPWTPGPASATMHYLCRVHEMKRMTRPIIEASRGIILNVIADRFVAVFRQPHDALSGLLQVNRRLASYNEERVADDRIAIGAGMGFGKVLRIGRDDVFGAEASHAFRLGGELARPFEILVSDAARASLLHTPGVSFRPLEREPVQQAFLVEYDLSHPDARPARLPPSDG
jgi:hypothetical protein